MGDLSMLSSGTPAPTYAADRNALFAALKGRVLPESDPSVLVIYGFVGLNEYAALTGEQRCASLVEWFGACIARVIGDTGQVFHARRREYFAVIEGGGDPVRGLVTRTRSELDKVGGACDVRACFGFALLPAEASFPTQALAVADDRLRAMVGNLRPAQR